MNARSSAAARSSSFVGCYDEALGGPNVQLNAEAIAFFADIDDPSLLPLTWYVCWVDDNQFNVSSAAYQQEKLRLQGVANRWTAGTSLNLVWRSQCSGPSLIDGKQRYTQEQIRIYMDMPPWRDEGERLHGPDCRPSDKFASSNWAKPPPERAYDAYRDTCLENLMFYAPDSERMFLHEFGHALGFAHEHERVDVIQPCWNYRPHVSIDPADKKPVPDLSTYDYEETATVEPGESATVAEVRLFLSIQHPMPSDLVVEVRSPNNTTITLHNRGVGPIDNKEWWSATDTILSPLLNSSVAGTWRLRVKDEVGGNTGTIVSWRLYLNKGHHMASDTIYASSYDGASVMNYGFDHPGCKPLEGPIADGPLSSLDHLGAALAYALADAPVIGEGVWPEGMAVNLKSLWIELGARRETGFPQPNSGFLGTPLWRVLNLNQSVVVQQAASELTTLLPPGSYITTFHVQDYWFRDRQHQGRIEVLTRSAHTAVIEAAL